MSTTGPLDGPSHDAHDGARWPLGDPAAESELQRPEQAAEASQLTAVLKRNRDVQDSRAVRLLATHNLALYVTLMQCHLDNGVRVTESDLVVRLERDLRPLGKLISRDWR